MARYDAMWQAWYVEVRYGMECLGTAGAVW